MNKEDENMDWEKDAPQLAALNKNNAFSVPLNYFENLSDQIINQIKLEAITDKNLGFETPAKYFENLESKLFKKTTLDEKIEVLSQNNHGFEIPENYFDTLRLRIEKTTSIKKTSKTKILTLKFIRFAAAACILLTTSLGIYYNIQRTTSVNYQLSKVSNEDIESYLNQNTDATDVNMILQNLENKPVFSLEQSQLGDDEIKNYLDSTY